MSNISLTHTETFKIVYADSYTLTLSRTEAQDLYDKLSVALNVAVSTGITFPRCCDEPNLPIGTKLLDDEGDTLERVEGGWSWHTVMGEHPWDGDVHPWSRVSNEHSFTVIA